MADAWKHKRIPGRALVAPRAEACLPCTFQRVKCERNQDWTLGKPCEDCKRKSIRCTFGDMEQRLRQNVELAELEVLKAVRVCLMDEHITDGSAGFLSNYQVPLHFAASLQMKMLAPTTKALLTAVIAAGARITSHPYITGKAPPAKQSGVHIRYDPQVSVRREAICTALLGQAIQIASESGVLQHAGPTQILTLATIGVALSRHDPQRRWMASILQGHQRQLQNQDATTGKSNTSYQWTSLTHCQIWATGLGWASCLYDAWTACEVGTPLLYSDEVVATISEALAARTGCHGPLGTGSRSVFDALRSSFELLLKAYHLVIKGGFLTQNTISPDFGKVAVIHAALDEAFHLRSHAGAFVPHSSQAQFIQDNIRLAASLACYLALTVQVSLHSSGLDAWQAQSQMRCLRECRCVVEAFRRTMECRSVQTTTPMGVVMRSMWDRAVDCMLGAPVTVSQGELDMMTWTAAEKMATIASASDVLEACAWSRPEHVPTLRRLQAVLHCCSGDERGLVPWGHWQAAGPWDVRR